jgi:hypothetical protein
MPIFVHILYSFCVFNFMLPARKQNFAEDARAK